MPKVNNIQYGVVTITAGLTYIDVNITAVVTNRTMCKCEVMASDSLTNPANYATTIVLTSTTTIRVERGSTTGGIVVAYEVTEFTADSGVSVQRGSTNWNYTDPTKDITITAVDLARSISLIYVRTVNSTYMADFIGTHYFTSTTNLRCEQAASEGNQYAYIEWQVITFGTDTTVQNITGNVADATTSYDVTISSVVTANSFLIFSHQRDANTTSRSMRHATLLNSTTVRMYGYLSVTWYYSIYVITSLALTVRRGVAEFGTASNITATWDVALTWAKSITNLVLMCGTYATEQGGTMDGRRFCVRSDKTTGYAFVIYKGVTDASNNVSVSWEAIEFLDSIPTPPSSLARLMDRAIFRGVNIGIGVGTW